MKLLDVPKSAILEVEKCKYGDLALYKFDCSQEIAAYIQFEPLKQKSD